MSELVLKAFDKPSFLIFGRLVATAFSLFTAPIIARAIGPEGRGETATAIAVFYLVPIVVAFGVPMEVRRLTAANEESFTQKSRDRVLWLALIPTMLICVLMYFFVFSDFSTPSKIIALFGTLLTPLSISWIIDINILVARAKYFFIVILQVAQPFVYFVIVLFLFITNSLTVTTVLTAYILGNVTVFIAGRTLQKLARSSSTDSVRSLLKRSLRYSGSSIAEAANNRIDQVLMLPLIGPAGAGLYSAAVTLTALPLVFGQALGAVHFRLLADKRGRNRSGLYADGIRQALAAAIIILPGCALVTYYGIPIIFGDQFHGAIQPGLVLCLGTAFSLVSYVISMMLAAEGHGWIMTFAQSIALLVSTSLLFILAPLYGAMGAAVSATIGSFILLMYLIFAGRLYSKFTLPLLNDFRALIKNLLRGS